ncbi:MAG: RluA family pseudouridine synthase [Gomphosphaeria aponina SAG 52.96 = DSM 107014]|uniref:Pseudouridine synthase n=1 Tax=Gomphosphaeria aponina SAG 52.96 = DSM 107014 TaxID=1521640 RepID=A0A941GNY8_9CHRO|nr:RluA family pseudouridine synthase [Gomphosphaeria aponina SAG 52.96 = DSM 107014]
MAVPILAQVLAIEVVMGERIDRCLAQQLPTISRSRLVKLIEQGQVKLNGQICTAKKTTVREGDRLHLTIPSPQPLNLQPEPIPLDILYEDEFLIIINKPPGLVVHPAPGHATGTLVHALLFHCADLAGIGDILRPGIVHRLDKDTSGALVVAKTELAHQHLQAQLKAKTAKREYLAVVHGVPAESSGKIDLPIGRHPVERQKMAVVSQAKGGRAAVTHWQILERLGKYTLMQFRLETGRTHQIRVHSSYIGHPIVADPVYSSGGSLGVNLPGQVLHAHKLTLNHPVSGEIIEAIAPLPPHFLKLLHKLRIVHC